MVTLNFWQMCGICIVFFVAGAVFAGANALVLIMIAAYKKDKREMDKMTEEHQEAFRKFGLGSGK